MRQEVYTVLTALITALLTAPLTVWFSLRRFHAERLWERKLEAYMALIEALHHLRKPYDEILGAWHDDRDGGSENIAKLWSKSTASRAQVLKYMDMWELVMSRQAAQPLASMLDELEKARRSTDWHEVVEESHSAIDRALKFVKMAAIDDLQIERASWLPARVRRVVFEPKMRLNLPK